MVRLDENRIAVNIKLFMLLVGVLFSGFGWITNKTLTNIDNSIKELNTNFIEVRNLTGDHETRIRIIEDRAKINLELIEKLEDYNKRRR